MPNQEDTYRLLHNVEQQLGKALGQMYAEARRLENEYQDDDADYLYKAIASADKAQRQLANTIYMYEFAYDIK